jgi:hypothetical protein
MVNKKRTYTNQFYQNLGIKHTCKDRTPYTYLIGWSLLNKWYYGRRTVKDVHPHDFWKLYFTSSNEVEKFRAEHGEPDIIQIRKVFNSVEKCINWELKILHHFDITKTEIWLNKRIHNTWDNTNKSAAKELVSGRKIGLVSLDDPRWGTGEIVTTSKGTSYKRKIKTVYNLYTGKISSIDTKTKLEPHIIAWLYGKTEKRKFKAEEIETGLLLGKLSVLDPKWITGKIKISDKTNNGFINFLRRHNLIFANITLDKLDKVQIAPRQKEAFVLRRFYGYTTAEVSKKMGCSEGSVKQHVFRAERVLVKPEYKLLFW